MVVYNGVGNVHTNIAVLLPQAQQNGARRPTEQDLRAERHRQQRLSSSALHRPQRRPHLNCYQR